MSERVGYREFTADSRGSTSISSFHLPLYLSLPPSRQGKKTADDAAAMQFSFFGDLSTVDDGSALEDGLEAPPEEERVFARKGRELESQNGGGNGDLS